MKLFTEFEELTRECPNSAVTVGTFDGVHVGHMKVIARLLSEAKDKGLRTSLVTFDPHPKCVVDGSAEPFMLTTVEEKARIIEQAGVDCMLAVKFDKRFASIKPGEFIGRFLVGDLKIREIIVGYDHHFGFHRSGDISLLRDEGSRLGFHVEVVPPALLDGLPVSSTRIRRVLREGDIPLANKMLGRPYNLSGRVVKGSERGKKVGYRTANILPGNRRKLLPLDGVYSVTVTVDEKVHDGVMNIGCAPTFKGKERSLEVHIIDFSGDIYGRQITVAFHGRIRGEVEFKSEEELALQISKDVKESKRLLTAAREAGGN